MIQVLAVLFLTGLLGHFWPKQQRRLFPYFCAGVLAASFGYFLQLVAGWDQQPLLQSLTWSKHFGVALSFSFDGLSAVFALLITGIGTGVFLYASAYMKNYQSPPSFFSTLMIFTSSMLGLVLSNNLLLTFIFWELTSITSFLLIGFHHNKPSVRDSARTSLYLTIAGGLCLLVALVLVSLSAQSMGLSLGASLTFSELVQISLFEHSMTPWVLLLIALAVATKSAQIPFHFWLPMAMAGPTPVSSFLHSATMVKAGVFLLAKFFPIYGSTVEWNWIFSVLGGLTMVTGAALSAAQTDMKKVLAYSTFSVLGTLVMLLGIATPASVKAAVVYLVAHAFYKASLFQIAGNIDRTVQSRDLSQNFGLSKVLPLSAAAAMLSALSMAGTPPLFGFFGKELAYMAQLEAGNLGRALMLLALLANILLVGVALSFAYRPFWQKSKAPAPNKLRFTPPAMIMSVVPFVFAFTGLVIGVFPSLFDKHFGTAMATSILGEPLKMKLKLWHGTGPEALTVLALSAITLGLGFWTAKRWGSVQTSLARFFDLSVNLSPTRIYQLGLSRCLTGAGKLTDLIQNGQLVQYLRNSMAALLLIVFVPGASLFLERPDLQFHWLEASLGLMISLPVVAALFFRNPLNQLVLIAASGFGIVVAFAIFSAIDLAMTQLMVECLSILFIFFLLKALLKSPLQGKFSWINTSLSFVAALLLVSMIAVTKTELPLIVSDYYVENSRLLAFGQNVVNVILVDFRSLDTFGEVIVVGIATLGVGSLLSQRFSKNGGESAQKSAGDTAIGDHR